MALETDNKRLEDAILFATQKHAGQIRKGTKRPYIFHPLEVMHILDEMHADTNLLIAGLLHDTVEDTDATIEELKERFGEDVATLVAGHTEDKSKSWQERKTVDIEMARNGSIQLKKLIMADKLANIRSMQLDYQVIGEDLWSRFNAGKEKQAWFYGAMIEALEELKTDQNSRAHYEEFVEIHRTLFSI